MRIIDLGLTDFSDAYRSQLELVNKVSKGVCEDTLLITEHNPVITIGRKGKEDNILRPREFLTSNNIDIFNIDRGGDVTYHGPGQIVAYPIFKLENESRDIHTFLSFLEEVSRHFLSQYGLVAEKRQGLRGVWVEEKKIGFIGLGVKKWTTYHGLSINVDLDLAPFSFIRPCGIDGIDIISLKEALHRRVDIEDAKERLRASFKEVPLLAEAVSEN